MPATRTFVSLRIRALPILQSALDRDRALALGPKLTDIVARFEVGEPVSPALVPIGGVQTSPMKLARSYAALKNQGAPAANALSGCLPSGREEICSASPRTEPQPARHVQGRPGARRPRRFARAGETRHGAAAANSVHALVYGKTGTLVAQRGCSVRRIDRAVRRQSVAWLRPAGRRCPACMAAACRRWHSRGSRISTISGLPRPSSRSGRRRSQAASGDG